MQPSERQGLPMPNSNVNWRIGVTPTGDVFMEFVGNGEKATFACPAADAVKIADALKDAAQRISHPSKGVN
jgi:hypothetical protein